MRWPLPQPLLTSTAVRQKELMVSSEVTVKGKKKKKPTGAFFGLFIGEKEVASFTELFIYLKIFEYLSTVRWFWNRMRQESQGSRLALPRPSAEPVVQT